MQCARLTNVRLLTSGLIIALYMLCVNMELADRMQESADDMTAALTAPSPKNDTHCGVR